MSTRLRYYDKQVNKLQYIYAVDYYPVTGRGTLLLHATTQVNLRNILLS